MDCDTIELADVAAERAVLSGIYHYRHDAFADVSDIIAPRTFTVDSNQAWYKCLEHLLQQGLDVVPDIPSMLSTAQALGYGDLLATDEERKHLRAITQMPVEPGNVRRLAAKIRKLEIARAGLAVADDIKGNLLRVTGDEPVEAILSLLESPVTEFGVGLASTGHEGPKAIGDGIDLWLAHLSENPVAQMGISSGFPLWDAAVGGGLRPGTINVFGARPKIGKTSTGITIARHVAGNVGLPVLYLDTEMQEDDHRVRSLAALSGVPMTNIETGQFARDLDFGPKVEAAAEQLKNMPYEMLSIAGKPFEETLAVMRRWVTKTVGIGPNGKANPCVIVFDYLKLMDSANISRNLQEFQVLGFMMTGLHNFAVKYGIPIVLFVQLNRDGIDTENSTAASGSDRIIWLCSNFTIYKKLSDEEQAEMTRAGNKYNRKFVVTDCRHGPGLDAHDFICVQAEMHIARITEGPTRSQLDRQQGGSSDLGGGNIAF